MKISARASFQGERQEEVSWKSLYDEGYDRFLEGEFGGEYQRQIIEDFEALLPESPQWLG